MLRHLRLSLLLTVIASSAAHAGSDPCKGVRADGATRTFETSGLTWQESDDQLTLQASVSKPVGFMAALRKKTERELPPLAADTAVTVTLDDGSTYSFRTARDVGPSVSVLMGALINHYRVSIALDHDQWELLASQGIARVHIDDDQKYAVEPSPKAMGKFSTAGRCMIGQ